MRSGLWRTRLRISLWGGIAHTLHGAGSTPRIISPYTKHMRLCQPIIPLLVSLACLGCVHQERVTPSDSLRSYLQASSETRRQWLLDGDIAPTVDLSEHKGGMIERGREASWTREARSPIKVRYDGSAWRLVSGVLNTRSAATPRQALLLLSRALSERDPILFLALLPLDERLYWSKERAELLLAQRAWRSRLLALLEEVLSLSTANEADDLGRQRALGGPEGEVFLVREEEGWRIRDIRPHAAFKLAPTPSDSVP